jgi:hypothetical protein
MKYKGPNVSSTSAGRRSFVHFKANQRAIPTVRRNVAPVPRHSTATTSNHSSNRSKGRSRSRFSEPLAHNQKPTTTVVIYSGPWKLDHSGC